MEALWRAASNENRSGEWGAVMAQLSDAVDAHGPEPAHAATSPFPAAAFRDLIGAHGITAAHYEEMTLLWRISTLITPVPARSHADHHPERWVSIDWSEANVSQFFRDKDE